MLVRGEFEMIESRLGCWAVGAVECVLGYCERRVRHGDGGLRGYQCMAGWTVGRCSGMRGVWQKRGRGVTGGGGDGWQGCRREAMRIFLCPAVI